MQDWRKVQSTPRNNKEISQRRKKVDKFDLRLRLENTLRNTVDAPQSLSQVGIEVGFSLSVLRRYLPDLCTQVAQRYRANLTPLVGHF